MRTRPRRLIVNADDLGLSADVDAGIVRAHRDGVVTSTTLMAGGPSAERALARVVSEAPRLAVGLHLDLTGLVPGGPLAVVQAFAGLPGEAVEEACEAQLERFRALSGQGPDHLDCHQHLAHFHPVAFAAYCAVARRHALPVRSPAPFLAAASFRAFVARVERENGVALGAALAMPAAAMAPALAAIWAGAGVRAPRAFVHDFYGTGATRARLAQIAREAGEGVTEVMCHPGEGERAAELAVLVDPGVRAEIAAAGVELATFADI